MHPVLFAVALLQPVSALLATAAYTVPRSPAATASRHQPVIAGGFEQRFFSKDGARLSLLVTGTPDASAFRGLCSESGASGIVYELSNGRYEIVAEGDRETLETLAKSIEEAAGESASLREAWQAPVGGYKSNFPVVQLQPKMGAKITMQAKAEDLDYISRHFQVEAVFNRGLTLKKSRPQPTKIALDAKGDSARLKSFVRWCYNGPPLAMPESVTVDWYKA